MKKVLVMSLIGFGYDGITSVIKNYCVHMDKNKILMEFITFLGNEQKFVDLFTQYGTVHILPHRKQALFSYLYALNRLLQKGKYDVIHIHGNSGTMSVEAAFARMNHVNKIIVHTHNTECTHPVVGRLTVPVMKLLATDFLACSEAAGTWLYGKNRYIVLNNAIDIRNYFFDSTIRDVTRKEFGVSGNFVIGHVGKFLEVKNHTFLIDIFEQYYQLDSSARLMLVGDGPKKQEIEKKIESKGLGECVIFVGSKDNVGKFYAAMDFFVLPSLYEGLPLVMLEGQASGLPMLVANTITQDAKCCNEVIYKSLSDGAMAWAQTIQDIKSSLGARANNIEAIRSHGFDIDKEADKLLTIYME